MHTAALTAETPAEFTAPCRVEWTVLTSAGYLTTAQLHLSLGKCIVTNKAHPSDILCNDNDNAVIPSRQYRVCARPRPLPPLLSTLSNPLCTCLLSIPSKGKSIPKQQPTNTPSLNWFVCIDKNLLQICV